ncbi:MAG: 4-hydroxybenzoate polyprenyltransferase [Betaproteobacteria bacterium RIFCSPLOWO2_12_FULL_62_58]|nr:MAG: 4-hydroxybenzoate polyprenyltransferase [Betaproteobacteria bacterium RIFCSPLOWO2_12_FULL_62_58]
MTLKERLDAYEQLMRLDKPIGILLLLWPVLWGLWLAPRGLLRLDILLIFMVGTVLMRSAGCIINDFADRNFDPHVARTRDRPLAARRVGPAEALALAAVLVALAFTLVLFLNRLTIVLAFVALFLAVTYPFTKRFFPLPQAYLGIAFGISIPMAFAAYHGTIAAVAWVMLAANVFWAIAYDTEYAMVDRDDDVKLGLKSSAILLGRFDVAAVMVCHTVFLVIMTFIGFWASLGIFYYVGIVLAAGFVFHQYQLIRERNRDQCFKAFLNNNWVGAAIFAGLALGLYLDIPMFR